MGSPRAFPNSGFGTDFAAKNGWDNIYVAQRYGTQYQGLSVEAFFDAVAPVAQGRDVVCYGPSLGAYAAFYYGGSIDARIIGGAPMFPAWPRFANRAYADLEITHKDLTEVPKSSKAPVVIYDPNAPRDQAMIDHMILPAYPELRLMRYADAGHTVLVTLQKTRQLKDVIMPLIVEDRVTEIRQLEEGTAEYHIAKGRRLRLRSPVLAKAEYRKALDLAPSRHTLALNLGFLIRAGFLDEAQALLDEVEARNERDLVLTRHPRQLAIEAGLRVAGGSNP